MNHTANRRASGPGWLVVTAIGAVIALLSSFLVAPSAHAQVTPPAPTELLQLSKDKSTWTPGPTPAILAWSSPFQNMSPGDVSEQEYFIRNNGDVPARVDLALMVTGVDDFSYLRGQSTIAQETATVEEITSLGAFYLIGTEALGTTGLSGASSEPSNTLTSGGVLQPGSIARVTNTFTFPAEVGRLPSSVQQRFMHQTTNAYFVPRVSFAGALSIKQATAEPIIAGKPAEFLVTGEPTSAVAGGSYVVTGSDGMEVHKGTLGPNGADAFDHTFVDPGNQTLTVTFVPAAGQWTVDAATITVQVLPEECSPGVDGSSGSTSGSTGSISAGSIGSGSGSAGSSDSGGSASGTSDCHGGGGSESGSSTGILSGVGGFIGVGFGLLLIAGIGYGIWYIAHEQGVPGVGPAPGQRQRVDAEGRAYSGPPATAAGATAAGPINHVGQPLFQAVNSVAVAFGVPGAGSIAPVVGLPDAVQHQDNESWFDRLVDSIRGLFN